MTAEPSDTTVPETASARDTVRLLFDRNLFPYLAANTLAGIGSWFQVLAQAILVFRLTESTFMLGVLGFAQLAAVFFLAPWTGSVADRFDRRHVLAVSELSGVVLLIGLTVTSALGTAGPLVQIVFALALGARVAYSSPSMMALVPTLVNERHFGAALALNSVTFNVGRCIGPVLAAISVATLGTTWSFGISAALSLPLPLAVLVVRPLTPHLSPAARPRLRESLRQVAEDRRLAGLLYVIAAAALCTDPAVTLGPAFMSEALNHRDTLAGLLVGAFGAGAVLAAFTISHRLRGTRDAIAGTLALAAVGAAGFALSPSLGLALGFLLVMGFGYLTTNVGATLRIQLQVEPEQRGRIMALWTICFLGIRPLGSLVDGTIAAAMGVRVAAFVMALPALAAVVVILYRRIDGARNRQRQA